MGWSQAQFADEMGIHRTYIRTYISDLKRGARNPIIRIIEKLAKPLGVEAGRLPDE